MDLNQASVALERRLRAAGLDPDRLEPSEAWRIFKSYAREAVACDGEAVYVQLGVADPTDELWHLTFIRHLEMVDPEGELEPVREIVCDLGYDRVPELPLTGLELCDLDFPTFQDFVAAVQARPEFQAAIARAPTGSWVSFSEL